MEHCPQVAAHWLRSESLATLTLASTQGRPPALQVRGWDGATKGHD